MKTKFYILLSLLPTFGFSSLVNSEVVNYLPVSAQQRIEVIAPQDANLITKGGDCSYFCVKGISTSPVITPECNWWANGDPYPAEALCPAAPTSNGTPITIYQLTTTWSLGPKAIQVYGFRGAEYSWALVSKSDYAAVFDYCSNGHFVTGSTSVTYTLNAPNTTYYVIAKVKDTNSDNKFCAMGNISFF